MTTYDARKVEELIAVALEWRAARKAVLDAWIAHKSPSPFVDRARAAEESLAAAVDSLEREDGQ